MQSRVLRPDVSASSGCSRLSVPGCTHEGPSYSGCAGSVRCAPRCWRRAAGRVGAEATRVGKGSVCRGARVCSRKLPRLVVLRCSLGVLEEQAARRSGDFTQTLAVSVSQNGAA